MIKFDNITVAGFEAAIRGMRNPKNSWAKSDSHQGLCGDEWAYDPGYVIGPADKDLMLKLNKGGPVHAKYRRQIVVWVDITAPLYWWKEFDTYRFGRERNSCSTMHKIAEREFTTLDFSNEHLDNKEVCAGWDYDEFTAYSIHLLTTMALNYWRNEYLKATEAKDSVRAKHCWWQLIQLNPDCYNQRATIMMSYEVLANIYKFRKGHKLDEWAEYFMEFINTLPYSWIITDEYCGVPYIQMDAEKPDTRLPERRYEPHPYDLSDDKKRRICEQPDIEPEFSCFIEKCEIPEFYNFAAMELYIDDEFAGKLWSAAPTTFTGQFKFNRQCDGYMLEFLIFDHEKGRDLQVEYTTGNYDHSIEIDPATQGARMVLHRKE